MPQKKRAEEVFPLRPAFYRSLKWFNYAPMGHAVRPAFSFSTSAMAR